MKKSILFTFLLSILFLTVSCLTTSNKDYPDTYVIHPDRMSVEYDVMGEVEMKAVNGYILGMFRHNSQMSQFEDFIEYAQIEYPGADAMINCYVDRDYYQYLFFYTKVVNRFHATVVKYR